jgi:hypothetical protein
VKDSVAHVIGGLTSHRDATTLDVVTKLAMTSAAGVQRPSIILNHALKGAKVDCHGHFRLASSQAKGTTL